MMVSLKEFSDRQELSRVLTETIATLLCKGITERGCASLAVSGGSTPVELFNRLSKQDIPWSQVVITLVDERWLNATDKDANENLVRTHLLTDKAGSATFIGLKNQAGTALAGEQLCEKTLAEVPRPFDALILGMGSDGHTASLFQGSTNLKEATSLASGRNCIAITPPQAPHDRMTLTLPAILDSKQIFLHITGKEKKVVLQQALHNGPATDMPIRFILQQQSTPLHIYWAP